MKPKYKRMLEDIKQYYPHGKILPKKKYKSDRQDDSLCAYVPFYDAEIYIMRRGVWAAYNFTRKYLNQSEYTDFLGYMISRGWDKVI